MKEYKIEVLRFIQKGMDSSQIVNESKAEIQAKLDEYGSKGYRVTSMTTDSGMVYLLFEKTVS
jgi:predicted GNAT superfamily acetyltransferase